MIVISILLVFMTLQLEATNHPVLLVPGMAASQIWAKYTKKPDGILCHDMNRSFPLWIDPFYFLPFTIECTINLLKLKYNTSSKSTYSPNYCEIDAPGFGSLDTIAYLSQYKRPMSAYFHGIINELMTKHNYSKNIDIRGAPYDFRKGLNEMHYLANVKKLIEEMFVSNQNKSVVIIAHSMGNLYVLKLLNDMPKIWKRKYIKSFISISAPYAGSMLAMKAVLSGYNSIMFILKSLDLRNMESTWPSLYYLFPIPEMWPKRPIVLTKNRNFTAQNIEELLKSSNITNAVDHFNNLKDYTKNREPPQVDTHCIISLGIRTPIILDYRDVEFPDNSPKTITTDGDGSVGEESLSICYQWKDQQKELVTLKTIPNQSHLQILNNPNIFRIINDIILKINS